MRITIQNEAIKAEIDTLGGELKSLRTISPDQEYLWKGDPAFWRCSSPILFPFVGGTRNREYRTKDRTFPTTQHGFARNMEFTPLNQQETDSQTVGSELWLQLNANEETKRIYPYDFRLFLGYRLEANTLRVLWRVENPAKEPLHFSIGGHPGFLCPIEPGTRQTDYSLLFDTPDQITATVISSGLATDAHQTHSLQDGALPITERLFETDALVLEHHQAHQVSFLKTGSAPYLTVAFDAPLFGIWAPYLPEVPFICIEPWYGRCDHESFTGTLEEREWGNHLQAGATWEASYSITIH